MIFTAEKALRDYGQQVPDETRRDIESKVEDVRQALDSNDADRIKRASDALGTAIQQIGAAMYGSQPGEQPPMGGQPGGGDTGYGEPTDEDVIEGDFTES